MNLEKLEREYPIYCVQSIVQKTEHQMAIVSNEVGYMTPLTYAEGEKLDNDCPVSILFIASDPTDTSRLRLQEEEREVREKLQLSQRRHRFSFHQRGAVRPEDFSQALLDIEPQIVHFSGHGTAHGELCFEDKNGKARPIPSNSLAALFREFSESVKCVVLNACYSEKQADAIVKHVDYVIGMDKAIGDKAAIAFSIGIYQALGAGKSFEEAYRLGLVQIHLQGIEDEHLTPILKIRADKHI